MEYFDCLVIGGGPAGAATAILLSRAGWSVLVAESKVFPRRKVCGEYLSGTNWPLFKSLGVEQAFRDLAGPPVTETAVFAGGSSAFARLPQPRGQDNAYGRALSRQHLDTLLLKQAAAKADVRQPCRCVAFEPDGNEFVVTLESGSGSTTVRARSIIAAHGSWELGELATQRQAQQHRPADWLAFKAHFRQASLPPGLMPLLSFPDGYGGMVHSDGGLASLSCCIQRQRLERLPRAAGESAGAAVLAHILESTPVLRPILSGAELNESWLAAGPIQPGFRQCFQNGVFLAGNAVAEAHPVVAEGISMAMQSAGILAQCLLPHRDDIHLPEVRQRVASEYTSRWKQSFSARIKAAAVIAQWAMRPKVVAATLPFLRAWPTLLTWGAQLSGKDNVIASLDGA